MELPVAPCAGLPQCGDRCLRGGGFLPDRRAGGATGGVHLGSALVRKGKYSAAIVEAEGSQSLNESAQDGIRLGDLAVVRRLARRMWLIDMEKEKEWLPGVFFDPAVGDLQRVKAEAPMFAGGAGGRPRNRVAV